jgi:hypothetical protein
MFWGELHWRNMEEASTTAIEAVRCYDWAWLSMTERAQHLLAWRNSGETSVQRPQLSGQLWPHCKAASSLKGTHTFLRSHLDYVWWRKGLWGRWEQVWAKLMYTILSRIAHIAQTDRRPVSLECFAGPQSQISLLALAVFSAEVLDHLGQVTDTKHVWKGRLDSEIQYRVLAIWPTTSWPYGRLLCTESIQSQCWLCGFKPRTLWSYSASGQLAAVQMQPLHLISLELGWVLVHMTARIPLRTPYIGNLFWGVPRSQVTSILRTSVSHFNCWIYCTGPWKLISWSGFAG